MSDARRTTPITSSGEPWWKSAVTYQIYPRSFCDTGSGVRGEGVGDLEGVRRHLDHLVWLGVDAIWLSPFFPSPMHDYGYDVADFCGVDPLFGDLDLFDALLRDAHQAGLKVLIDWVPNHTSIEHPWFAASRRSKDDPQRDWYVWRDPAPDGGPPNNWTESLTMGPAWTLDGTTGQYYLHCFLPEQPDLDWSNHEVVDAMGDTLRFWLDRGVDGFRMDVVHLIGKDPALPDESSELVGLPHVVLNSRPETHDHLRGIRKLLDGYDGDRVSVGEVYLLDTDLVAEHYGHDDELHLCFNFPPLYASWDAVTWRGQIERTAAALDHRHAWPTWVLSNHDNPRHRTRYGSEERARAAAVLLLTLRGTAFVYAGEELGLLDAVVPDDRRHDPAGRDGCRAPIPWDASPTHGWTDDEPWLPWPPDPDVRNVETQRADAGSILHLYRDLLALRRATPSLSLGSLTLLDPPDGVLAYRRTAADHTDDVVVAINFTDAPVPVGLDGDVLLSTHATAGAPFGGTLAADEAIILR